jgi:hypothetical protein
MKTLQYTDHARMRMAQRGIQESAIEFVIRYGHKEHRQGYVFYFLGRKNIPKAMKAQMIDRCINLIVVISGSVVVTCYCKLPR